MYHLSFGGISTYKFNYKYLKKQKTQIYNVYCKEENYNIHSEVSPHFPPNKFLGLCLIQSSCVNERIPYLNIQTCGCFPQCWLQILIDGRSWYHSHSSMSCNTGQSQEQHPQPTSRHVPHDECTATTVSFLINS